MNNTKQLTLPTEGESKVDLFRRKQVRKVMHEKEWWFALKDVIEALTNSEDPKSYIKDMRERDPGLKSNWGEIVHPVEFVAADGKQRLVSAVNIEGIFRLVQSIPSKNVEPFKKWLAKVGYERLQEIQNPEIAIRRAIMAYKLKGYDDEWIKARIGTVTSRRELTDEWQKRGIKNVEYAILTDAISIKTFGLKTNEHKKIKGLNNQPLRDHMTPVELALTMLGETSTVKIAQKRNALGFSQNKIAAEQGGEIAGDARLALESQLGESLISQENYLSDRQKNNEGFDDVLDRLMNNPTSKSE